MLLCSVAIVLFFGYSLRTATHSLGETQNQPLAIATPQRIVVFPLFAEEMLLEMIGPSRIVYVGHEYWDNGEAYSPTMELTKHILGSSDPTIFAEDFPELEPVIRPDLVVLWAGDYDYYETLLPELQQAGVSVLFLDTPKHINDIMNTISMLGNVVGAPEKAAHMVQTMKTALAQLTEILSTIPDSKRVRAAHYENRQDNYQLITRAAGIIDVSGSDADYIEMSHGLLAKWNPDLITVNPFYLDTDGSLYDIGEDYVEKSIAYLLDDPKLSNVTAIKSLDVHPLSLHESQFVIQSVMDLARMAYPDLFPEN